MNEAMRIRNRAGYFASVEAGFFLMILHRSVNSFLLLVMIPVHESFSDANISLFCFGNSTDF